MRECGLKLLGCDEEDTRAAVTPHAGVWIETVRITISYYGFPSHSPCGSVD